MMKRINNSNIWFDGIQYWIERPKGTMNGPYTNEQIQSGSVQGDDSTVIELDKTILYPVK